jgi:anti-sigma regulatory factor (Ser/Thr protein kinase)
MLLYKNEISSTFEAVHETVGEVMDQLKLVDDLNKNYLLFRINFMLREVLNNAVEHGNRFNKNKRIWIEVALENRLLITKVQDEGEGIKLESTYEHNMDNILRERRRGISLVRQYQFELEVNDTELCVILDLDSVVEEV